MPDKTTSRKGCEKNVASIYKLRLEEEPAAYQLVGRVTAYQGV